LFFSCRGDHLAFYAFPTRRSSDLGLGRVYFWNPVRAGFIDETHHLEETGRFLAPMDQTHTVNAGLTYRYHRSGLWARMAFEYGRSEEHTSELQSRSDLVCRLLLEK